MTEDEWPYVICEPCRAENHADCIGLTRSRPFCGCPCGWLETIEEDDGVE